MYGCDQMQEIDLSLLHSNVNKKIIIDDLFEIPESFYKDTDIRGLSKISVVGSIKRETDDIDYIDIDVTGTMILQDSISLKDENYPFSFKIEGDLEEFVINLENSLDILQLLWENIVLEMPLKFTKVEDLSKFHGDGWKLVSEEDATTKNNPFKELLENEEEE